MGLTFEGRVEVRIGTRLEADFLVEARAAAQRASRASKSPEGLGEETRGCILAVLVAHAAIEAFINQEGADRASAWWEQAERDRVQVDGKWRHLAALVGADPRRGSGWYQGVRGLTFDRNLVAHYKGVPQPGGLALSGPPVSTRGRANISPVRAYFNAPRARLNVERAVLAIRAFYAAVRSPVPDFLEPWVRDGSVWGSDPA